MSTGLYKAVISGVGHYVPDHVVKNKDLEKFMDTSDEWIQERTGIKERRWVQDEETTTSDLGVHAAKNLLAKTATPPHEIDFLIAATLSPDFYFPGIGTAIQTKLSLGPIGALDIRTQCSAFPYGLATANGLIRAGTFKNILFIGAELHSKVLDKTTRGRDVAVLFGDAAAATLISAEEVSAPDQLPSAQNTERGIIDTILGSDGTGAEILTIRSPGLATPGFMTQSVLEQGAHYPYMEGRAVFKQAVKRMLEAATEILKRNGITPDDVDLVVPHQANLRINDAVTDRLGIPPERVFNNIQKYGNTTAATIPLCLSEAEAEGKLKRGDLVLTVAFGAGFTWGASLFRW